MAVKARYNVSLPDHVSAELEKHAKAIRATPTEYAGDIIRWWYGLGAPAVRIDEQELRKRILPVPKDFDVWKLDPAVDYQLVDEPAEKALKQLGLPNLFAREKEHDVARFLVAFDNHPTHWLVFNFFKGGKTSEENGLSFSAYSKIAVTREAMQLRLTVEGKKMEADGPIEFSQIPSRLPAKAKL